MNWKNWIFALLICSGLISCDKNDTEKGMDLYLSGEFDKAIQMFDSYLSDHPKDHESLYNRGRAYEELNQLDKALADFRTATKLSPKNATYWISSGICNIKLKKYESTISNMNAVLDFQERNTDALVLKGRACSYAGKVRSAMDAFELAIKYNKDCGDAYLHRGLLRAKAHDLKTCDDLRIAKRLKAQGASKAFKRHCN